MSNLIVDLYSITHEFYRGRKISAAKIHAEAVCILTILLGIFNVINLIEFGTGIRVVATNFSRIEIIVIGTITYGFGILCMKWFIQKNPLIQSEKMMREHSNSISRARKMTLLGSVIANVALFAGLSAYLRN